MQAVVPQWVFTMTVSILVVVLGAIFTSLYSLSTRLYDFEVRMVKMDSKIDTILSIIEDKHKPISYSLSK